MACTCLRNVTGERRTADDLPQNGITICLDVYYVYFQYFIGAWKTDNPYEHVSTFFYFQNMVYKAADDP